MKSIQNISNTLTPDSKNSGDLVPEDSKSRSSKKLYPIKSSSRISYSSCGDLTLPVIANLVFELWRSIPPGLPRRVLLAMTVLFLSSAICYPTSVSADTLTSPAFEIDMSTINITGGRKSNPSGSINLTDTVGQTFQGRFDSNGYVIKAGFQYIYANIPFTFTISDLDLDFGSLVPGTPSLLTNLLTVTTGSAYGYAVKAIEDHALRLINGSATIPDTSCDLASPCTQTDATAWTDNSRYGFGYNIQGDDVDIAEFVNNSYFRPFPIQNTDQPATVMSRSSVATDSAATVTYKVNISGSQAAGTYQNNLQYIAIPAF